MLPEEEDANIQLEQYDGNCPDMLQNTPSIDGSTNFHDNDSLEEDGNKRSNHGMKRLFFQ